MKQTDTTMDVVPPDIPKSFWQEVRRPIVVLLCIVLGFVGFRLVVINGTFMDQNFQPAWMEGDNDLYEAKKAVQAANFPKARLILTKLLEKEPNYGAANALLGYVCLQQDRLDDAVRYYEKAAQYEPSDGKIQDALEIIRSRQQENRRL